MEWVQNVGPRLTAHPCPPNLQNLDGCSGADGKGMLGKRGDGTPEKRWSIPETSLLCNCWQFGLPSPHQSTSQASLSLSGNSHRPFPPLPPFQTFLQLTSHRLSQCPNIHKIAPHFPVIVPLPLQRVSFLLKCSCSSIIPSLPPIPKPKLFVKTHSQKHKSFREAILQQMAFSYPLHFQNLLDLPKINSTSLLIQDSPYSLIQCWLASGQHSVNTNCYSRSQNGSWGNWCATSQAGKEGNKEWVQQQRHTVGLWARTIPSV